MCSPFPIRAALAAAFVILVAASAHARSFRVCADPNNLPYSNERREGFENRIAEILAADLGADLEYTWWPQRRGFLRYTVDAGACDVVMGVPEKFEKLLTTRPYYRSSYLFVTRSDRALDIVSLDDPRLRTLRVGVQLVTDEATSPPAHALADRGIVENVRGFLVNGDYSTPAPTAPIVEAVARGDIDVAAVWGPQAGYFAMKQAVPLSLVAIEPLPDAVARPMTFDISVGVRRGQDALRREIDEALARRRGDVEGILTAYGVPQFPGDGAGDGP